MTMPIDSNGQSLWQKSCAYLKGFGMRILVHGAALLCAGVIAGASVGSFVFLGTYLGIICLVARETSTKVQWVFPASMGLVQCVVCFALGLPLYQGIFWGGFQAYVQRIFAKKFAMGFEWIVGIFLLPVALDALLTLPNFVLPLATILVLSAIGGVFWRFYNVKKKTKKIDNAKNAPKEEHTPVQNEFDPYADYHASIAKLRVKQILLPKALQKNVQSLAISAEAIILCMKEDARDTDLGKRFLNRYLPATHSVLDNYRRHSKDAENNAQVAKALEQSKEILIRLDQAFANEHSHLQRNNIDDFSAEIRVLDTLLKMEGH